MTEATSVEQLQFARRSRRRYQCHSRASVGADKGASSLRRAETIHAPRNSHGNAKEPFRVQIGMVEHAHGAHPLSALALPRFGFR